MPAIDFVESDRAYELTAELPGINAKELDLTFANSILTVKGEKHEGKQEKGKRSFRCALTQWIVTPAAAYAAVDLAKLNGSRSLILAPSGRCGNSVKTCRNQANGSTPQARQVSIRL
ncbi:Hsp20/alpha crystallin family protein [Rhizobium sp. WW_1]|nr:Hsp20/alpha crystallin family protein [Rhizobium sp. WW_1]